MFLHDRVDCQIKQHTHKNVTKKDRPTSPSNTRLLLKDQFLLRRGETHFIHEVVRLLALFACLITTHYLCVHWIRNSTLKAGIE